MSVKKNILNILHELKINAQQIDTNTIELFLEQITQAHHIFLSGAGRSGVVIQAFANRLVHLGFSVSVVGEISSPSSQEGDLLIICSGSGETESLKGLAKKATQNNVKVVLVSMKKKSAIGKVAETVIKLPGVVKENNIRKNDEFSQPMGSVFEQLSFLLFDSIILELMDILEEDSNTMFTRHADFE